MDLLIPSLSLLSLSAVCSLSLLSLLLVRSLARSFFWCSLDSLSLERSLEALHSAACTVNSYRGEIHAFSINPKGSSLRSPGRRAGQPINGYLKVSLR